MAESTVQKLALPALIAMVVGSMIGSGIFTLPSRFAGATGVYGALIAWVIAAGGILGRISKISENYVTIEIADKVRIEISKSAVGGYQGQDPVAPDAGQS